MCRLPHRSKTPILLLLTVLAGSTTTTCAAAAQRAEFWAFTAPWDPRSAQSVASHGDRLDALVTGWITIDSASGQPILPSPYPDPPPVGGTTGRMALVTSWHGTRFHAAPIRRLARDPQALARAAATLGAYAEQQRYDGLIFDFETLEPSDLAAQVRVLGAFADSARTHGVSVIAAAIPATDTAAYPAAPLLEVADALLVMLYDQHWLGSEPGPVADPRWVRASLDLRIREVGADPLIAGLPLYGYRWTPGAPTLPVSFVEAQTHAEHTAAPLQRDPASRTLHSRTADGAETWVTDARLLQTLIAQTRAAGVHRFAFWRLGQEDPAIWNLLFE